MHRSAVDEFARYGSVSLADRCGSDLECRLGCACVVSFAGHLDRCGADVLVVCIFYCVVICSKRLAVDHYADVLSDILARVVLVNYAMDVSRLDLARYYRQCRFAGVCIRHPAGCVRLRCDDYCNCSDIDVVFAFLDCECYIVSRNFFALPRYLDRFRIDSFACECVLGRNDFRFGRLEALGYVEHTVACSRKTVILNDAACCQLLIIREQSAADDSLYRLVAVAVSISSYSVRVLTDERSIRDAGLRCSARIAAVVDDDRVARRVRAVAVVAVSSLCAVSCQDSA